MTPIADLRSEVDPANIRNLKMKMKTQEQSAWRLKSLSIL